MILKKVVGKYSFAHNPNGEIAADVDGNGVVNAADALCVLRLVVGKPAL